MQEAVDWLVFGAHPDDVEIGMGGTISRFTREGKRIVVCDLTRAEMSSNGDPISRQAEAKAAAQIMGIQERLNLHLPDRGIARSREQLDAVVQVIRKYKPRFVFAPVSTDRHPDHVHTSELITEALLDARLRKILPELPAWTVQKLWYYHIHQWNDPKFFIDISTAYEYKRSALLSYTSQFTPVDANSPEQQERVSTPINRRFLEQVEARDRLWGYRIGCEFAEAFTTTDAIALDDFI